MKRVIVTGANGFVGCNIVGALLNAGYVVSAVDLDFDNPAYGHLLGDNLRQITADCVKLPPLNAHALIHAAAVTATPEARGESPEDNLRANIEPLLAVSEYVERQGFQRAIFISSTAVFRGAECNEASPPRPLGAYSVAKAVVEHTVATLRTVYGRDVLAARLSGIYGPYEYARSTRPRLSALATMLREALTQGEITVAQPDERRRWTYAPDIGRALIALLEADTLRHSLYQVESGDSLSNLALARAISRVCGDVPLRVIDDEAEAQSAMETEDLRPGRLQQ
ncbi:MAG: NAD(P)-dependent oxidoreductase, partial [Anaerolineae bacterium]|nr:NAD(P)-dependent oxidoreductase [Anaerolineae bacterium]